MRNNIFLRINFSYGAQDCFRGAAEQLARINFALAISEKFTAASKRHL